MKLAEILEDEDFMDWVFDIYISLGDNTWTSGCNDQYTTHELYNIYLKTLED